MLCLAGRGNREEGRLSGDGQGGICGLGHRKSGVIKLKEWSENREGRHEQCGPEQG